jgi:hypothetical protein
VRSEHVTRTGGNHELGPIQQLPFQTCCGRQTACCCRVVSDAASLLTDQLPLSTFGAASRRCWLSVVRWIRLDRATSRRLNTTDRVCLPLS